jgi:hypothetical protein
MRPTVSRRWEPALRVRGNSLDVKSLISWEAYYWVGVARRWRRMLGRSVGRGGGSQGAAWTRVSSVMAAFADPRPRRTGSKPRSSSSSEAVTTRMELAPLMRLVSPVTTLACDPPSWWVRDASYPLMGIAARSSGVR